MEDNAKSLILAILILIFTVLSIYFFSLTNISINMLLSINFMPVMVSMISLNFLLSMLTVSLTIALILITGRVLNKPLKEIIPSIGLFIGIIIGLFLFNLFEYFAPLILLTLGIHFTVNYLDKREEEVKYLKRFRAGRAAAGRFLIIGTLIFVLYLLVIGYSAKETLGENVIPDIIKMVAQENSTIGGIPNSPQLGTILENTFRQMPFLKLIESTAWLLYPINVLIILTFINGILIQNLAAFIYWIIDTLIKQKQPASAVE